LALLPVAVDEALAAAVWVLAVPDTSSLVQEVKNVAEAIDTSRDSSITLFINNRVLINK
jgi:hypothetical protein